MPATFAELGLHEDVLRAIDALGFEEPTPIQAQTVPLLLAGRDVLAQAQTGTGKTAAFALPIVQRVDARSRDVQAIVLAPTRELAVQVAEAMHNLGASKGLSVLPIYGGQAYDRQLRGLRMGVQVVVGTPGRIMDHMRRGTLDLSNVRMVVLDEADEMLNMGFVEDIQFILDQVPEERQLALFSATIPRRVETLAQRYMRDPALVSIAHEAHAAPSVRQMYVATQQRDKIDALTRLLDLESPSSAIVFCRTKREVDELSGTLMARGYAAVAIHGDVAQNQRERLLNSFRDGQAELLIATEVAARGLDIPDVTHVFNFDIPDDADVYVHRIGRTGRMGKSGDAITFVTPREVRQLRYIEREIGQHLEPIMLPTADDIAARKRETLRAALVEAIEAGAAISYAGLVESLLEEHEPAQVAAAAIYLANGGAAGHHEEPAAPDEAPAPWNPDVPRAPRFDDTGEAVRLQINAGRRAGVRAGDIVGLLTAELQIPGTVIGAIRIAQDFSTVEMEPRAAHMALEHRRPFVLRGMEVRVMPADGRDADRPDRGPSRDRRPGPPPRGKAARKPR
ncbi:MAG: DEAD/DEAH box helicase [Dehalococcoidia bacterium]